MATGRDVLAVAHESFALTLYTHWHLEQRRRLTMLTQKSERLDLAGLMAGAYHDPKSLVDRHAEFMESVSLIAPPRRAAQVAAKRAQDVAAVVRAMLGAPDVHTVLPS